MSAAVVLMAYGSPERLADVPAYYADIRGGRPIAPENLADLVERYRRLGIEDSSPLNAITEAARAALEAELGVPVFSGMKHWTPRIADAAGAALAGGADVLVGLVLAPHYSVMSIKGYRDQLEGAVAGRAELRFVESWHKEPGFIDLLAGRVRGSALVQGGAHVVFTAHSLPERILALGDPYKAQLLETAGARRRAPPGSATSGASPSRASRRPASRGSARTSSTTSRRSRPPGSGACSSARSASSPTTSRSAGTSTSRPARRRPSSASSSSGSRCRTPTRRSWASSRRSSGGPSRYRPTA